MGLDQRKSLRATPGGTESESSRIPLFLMLEEVMSRKKKKSWYT